MTTSHVLAANIVALALVALAPAQEQGNRGRYAGWVADVDGKRVVDAAVVLISRPLPGRPDLGTTDELRVRTGKDGMFRTTLLHGRAYSAWATWRDEHDLEHRSMILESVFPGPPRAIEETAKQTARTIRVTDAEQWQQHAPLQLTALTSSDNVAVVPVVLNEQGIGNLQRCRATRATLSCAARTESSSPC